jgi:1,4-dihydroxy-2-naphthoate octaprenyltransferase
MKIKAWLNAARLRTLPLSVSGIIVGSGLAAVLGEWDGRIFALAMLTTIGFQVISNFANDLGDSQKGTDNENRV